MVLRRSVAVFVLLAAIGAAAALASDDDDRGARVAVRETRARTRPHARPTLLHVRALGRSVQGRMVKAYELGSPRAKRKVVVVGCIHGNEPAGTRVLARLAAGRPLAGVDLWLIPTINPDGQAAHRRQNAHRVDLNRNFPWHWQPLGPRGTQQYAGPRPLSEPESRVAHSLIDRLRPAVTIWFHQPRAVVDESGGSIGVERRFARLAHLPLRRLTRYPGSAASWQNSHFPGTSAFVVELPAGTPTSSELRTWARAVRVVAADT
jgi:murein peptide amidase A